MPGFILHVGAQVMCAHGGQAIPAAPSPRVKVNGTPIAVQPVPYTVAGCAFPPPPAGTGPCVTALFAVGATRVKSMGMPVVLSDGVATCVPTGTPLQIVQTQTRVRAI